VSPEDTGRLLGARYRLVREIARGGMAAVWEAHDAALDRRVAVKLLHPQFASDPEFLERFRREARAAASLSHPNIVPIFDVGEDTAAGTPFIVMELVPGGNLKEHIRGAAPLGEPEIRTLGSTLAATLGYAHGRGIIHRDVKPHNILLGDDGRPRLTDFGIAQALASSGLTRTGAVMGSVHYIAPELVRGRPATPQSDIYSLGAVLYEMATGRVPFSAETELAVALAHVEETPATPRTFNARLSPALEQTILRALAKRPEERFASAGDLAAALRDPSLPTLVAPLHGPAPAAGRQPPAGARPASAAPAAATRRIATAPVPPPNVRAAAAAAYAPGAARRRTAPPPGRRGPGGGVLSLLLAMAAVLVALGAGFFGLATLSREGLAPAEPTAVPPTARPTAQPTAVAVLSPSATPLPAVPPTATPEPPSPTPLPPSPTPQPPSPTPAPAVPPPPSVPPATPTPQRVAVPQLRGKRLDDARAALGAVGLTTTVRGAPANVDKDVVFDQSPDAGVAIVPGATVSITVGNGTTAVPDVAERTPEQATKLLQDNSFRVLTQSRRDPRIPAGLAIGTLPAAGTAAPRGAEITLLLSAGR